LSARATAESWLGSDLGPEEEELSDEFSTGTVEGDSLGGRLVSLPEMIMVMRLPILASTSSVLTNLARFGARSLASGNTGR